MISIAAGVFSETLDYSRRVKIRPELSFPQVNRVLKGAEDDEKPNDFAAYGQRRRPIS